MENLHSAVGDPTFGVFKEVCHSEFGWCPRFAASWGSWSHTSDVGCNLGNDVFDSSQFGSNGFETKLLARQWNMKHH